MGPDGVLVTDGVLDLWVEEVMVADGVEEVVVADGVEEVVVADGVEEVVVDALELVVQVLVVPLVLVFADGVLGVLVTDAVLDLGVEELVAADGVEEVVVAESCNWWSTNWNLWYKS